jgi:hypothetical protein
MESWGTGDNLLKLHHFEFPSRSWSFMGAHVTDVRWLPSGTGVESLPGEDASVLQSSPVTRRYQPEPAALEELVDVLYRLLVDVPLDEPAAVPAPSKPTCFSIAPE